MKSVGTRFRFGPFVLDPGEQVLLRRGQPVKLARLDFALLLLLVERAGSLVRKDEVLERLWPDTVVEEGNLTKHVSLLRKALGDGDDGLRLIETVPRVGFRFVAPVERLEPSVGAPAPSTVGRQRTWRVGASVAVVALAGVTMVAGLVFTRPPEPLETSRWSALAVLPFRTLDGGSEKTDPLGIGLADGIITRLSGQKVLPVRPTSAIRSYASDEARTPATVGRELQAGILLDGHIQRAADLVRVTVQLTEVASGATVWADTFDQPAAELFKLEDAIAERVAAALRLQLAAAEQARLRRRYTENSLAYASYIEGREALLRYKPDGTRQAVVAFERALRLDPRYALASAGLATASADMYLRFAPESELQHWGERADREAAAALALDPDLAEAHVARAAVLRKREFDWDQTIIVSRQALTLNPNLDQPHFYAAAAFYHFGLMQEATAELELGRRTGGNDSVEPLRIEALIALFSGNYEVARQRLGEVSRRSNRAIGDVYLALASYYVGEVAQARKMLEALAAEPSASTAARAGAALAGVLAKARDPDGARRVMADVLNQTYRDHHVAYSLGAAMAQLGNADEAVRWLRTAADTGFPCATWFATDPLLDPLRSDPQFATLLSELANRRDAAATRHAR